MEEAILNNNNKAVTLVLISAIAMSCICLQLKPINAQSVPIPSVPEFTLNYINSLWSNGTQQYDNNTIVITIKNQQYSASINGTSYQIFYDIRLKVHSAQDWQWTDLHPVGTYYEKEFTDYQQKPLPSIREGTPVQSSSQYTVVPLSYYNPPLTGQGISFPINSNSTIDIQIKAYVGYSSQGWVAYQLPNPCLGGQFMNVTAVGTSSNWSSTQTITIPAISTSPSPTIPNSSPTLSPSIPEFPILAIIPLIMALISAAIIMTIKKPSSKQSS
jgi:hypothetical protein